MPKHYDERFYTFRADDECVRLIKQEQTRQVEAGAKYPSASKAIRTLILRSKKASKEAKSEE